LAAIGAAGAAVTKTLTAAFGLSHVLTVWVTENDCTPVVDVLGVGAMFDFVPA
jgi:Na+-transporting methylmalonyl-CoA/oxaloacetate decarboxylase beta subunit